LAAPTAVEWRRHVLRLRDEQIERALEVAEAAFRAVAD
jgi:hypothetical protein